MRFTFGEKFPVSFADLPSGTTFRGTKSTQGLCLVIPTLPSWTESIAPSMLLCSGSGFTFGNQQKNDSILAIARSASNSSR